MPSFRAMQASENADGSGFSQAVVSRDINDLPPHDLLVRVHWSALNYKDALSASGHKGVTRTYPHTPGIDAAGVVAESGDARFEPGDEVIVTSYDLGMNTSGGLAEYIRVPADWAVPLPEGLSLRESMILGTGGLTAGMALYKLLRNGQIPAMGPLVVTGASGGVGSLAVALLARAGFEVHAVSGSPENYDWLMGLGATKCLGRDEVIDSSSKPILRSRWSGGIDTVGGAMLASLVRACAKEGGIAVCGLVGSPDLPLTVYPFILNGVNLFGIDSAECPRAMRETVWQALASDWKLDNLEHMASEIGLEDVPEALQAILAGKSKGRYLVRLGAEPAGAP